MGSAILRGVVSKKIVRADKVFAYDVVRSKSQALSKRLGVQAADSFRDLVVASDVLILAVKPQDLTKAGAQIKSALKRRKIIISILAGTRVGKLKKFLGTHAQLVRAMPNLGATVGEAITAITSHDGAALRVAEQIFFGCGRVICLEEKHFDLVTAMSGSGPAYFFLLMELLAAFGTKQGLTRKVSEQLAIQTAVGAGKLAQVSPFSPAMLREMVTSRKGTTAAALEYLKKERFSNIFQTAISKAVKRSQELSR